MYKICIWTSTVTHHLSDFYDALVESGKIDLEVRYFNRISQQRISLGWEDKKCTKPYEKQVSTFENSLESLSDFSEYTHIIFGNGYEFTKLLIPYAIENSLRWINWTERGGAGLFKLLRENSVLFKIIFPIYQRLYNKKFSQQIESHALGTFVSGIKAEEDYLKKGVRKEKIKHLYWALNPLIKSDVIPKELKSSRFKYNFIYVGSLSQRKGVDILLKSYSKLNQNEWGLILVGKDVSNGKYKKMVEKLNIQNNVTFIGAIYFDRVNEYMSFADVFVLPTRFDGWGAVLNEAASIGLPIISTDECGASYHLIKNAHNGYMVKAGSVASLLQAMKKYVESPDLIQQHGGHSFELFKQFLPEENVNRLLAALEAWN
jgi:glycosyltransferase involved in cell wall biosynthesis